MSDSRMWVNLREHQQASDESGVDMLTLVLESELNYATDELAFIVRMIATKPNSEHLASLHTRLRVLSERMTLARETRCLLSPKCPPIEGN